MTHFTLVSHLSVNHTRSFAPLNAEIADQWLEKGTTNAQLEGGEEKCPINCCSNLKKTKSHSLLRFYRAKKGSAASLLENNCYLKDS